MNSPATPQAQEPPGGDPGREQLGVQIEAMQALLVTLLQDIVRAESRLAKLSTAEMTAAVNEQLVLSALASRDEAEAASRSLEEATRASLVDPLTGLPNRVGLLGRFEQALANARRHHGRCALLFFDLDNFKQINDRHGHAFGDRVLKLAAQRLAAGVREVDTVCRYGGDEFVVLLTELAAPGDAIGVTDKLMAAIAMPANIGGVEVVLAASAGVAIYPDDGENFEALVRRADAVMYEAKRMHAQAQGRTPAGAAPPGPEVRTPDASRDPVPAAAAGEAMPATGYDRRLAELREANERLVLAAIDARELMAAAEKARRRQTAFLAAVAEELRNPKAPIRIATTMLGLPPADTPLLPRVRSIVEEQLAQIARLVDAVMLDSGGMQLQRTRIDLCQVVESAISSLEPSFKSREQTLTLRRPPESLEAYGDADKLGIVVSNLLDNASRYTPERGHIVVVVEADPRAVTLTVSDDGIGITPELLPAIFEPFVQDPRALAYSGVGLGIGLTVAREIVRAHGGQISVHSAGPRRGTQAVVSLPRAPSEPPSEPGQPGTAGTPA